MTESYIASLSPFEDGVIHTMLEPGDVVTQPLWPEGTVRRVHVVRIGGAGMSAVARLALEKGLEVSGSESQDGQFLEPLRSLGASITVGFDAANVGEGVDVVVVSTAVRADNPEVIRARELGIPVIHRAAGLQGLLGDREIVAVAGTHGKTTTTAMTVLALREAGEDPAWAVGAAVPQLGANSGFGSSKVAVIEADESDGSFVAFAPAVAILTNFEADHLDFHGTEENLRAVLSAFISRVRESDGCLVACADDPGSADVARKAAREGVRTVTYGASPEASWRIVEDLSGVSGARIVVQDPNGERATLELAVPGRHNALNALAAFIAGDILTSKREDLARGLSEFRGAQRRFQVAGQVGEVRVVDDYAHHPREIAATIAAAREAAEGGEVFAVFQPHLFSRTKAFTREFAASLEGADRVALLPIYPAREDFDPSISSEDVASLVVSEGGVPPVYGFDEAPARIADNARGARVILMMGAGDINELTPRVLDELEARSS